MSDFTEAGHLEVNEPVSLFNVQAVVSCIDSIHDQPDCVLQPRCTYTKQHGYDNYITEKYSMILALRWMTEVNHNRDIIKNKDSLPNNLISLGPVFSLLTPFSSVFCYPV